MKTSIHKYCAIFLTALTISSCTKVDVPVESELTPSNFPVTSAQFTLASGAAYVQLRGSFA